MLLSDLAHDRLELFWPCRGVDYRGHFARRQTRLPRVRIAGPVADTLDRGKQLFIRRHRLGRRGCGPARALQRDVSRPLHAGRQYPGMSPPTIHPGAAVNERLARTWLARRGGILRAQTIQHSPFHAIELVSVRHDCRDLALLGYQKPLKLTHAYRGIDGEVRPTGGGAI